MLPVSVIIATRNRAALLDDAIASILAGDELPAELVVADQSPGTPPPLPDGGPVAMVHLHLRSSGLSSARNPAVAAARHDLLVFCDDDVVVDRAWLRSMVAPLAPDRRLVSTGAVLAGSTEGYVPSVTRRTEPARFRGRQAVDVLFGNSFAVPRRAFADVGPFDERLGPGAEFPSADDNDFGFRLLEAGYEIAFLPEAIVHHRGARRGRDLLALDWIYGRGQGAFYAKHTRRSDRHMLRRLVRDVRYRLRRMLPPGRRTVRQAVYVAGVLSGALGWWRRYGRGSSVSS